VILTELPDVPPRPETPRNAAFRREFYRRWGRENCVISGSAHRAEYNLFRQALSIKCVAHGTEDYFLDRRRIRVSDATYLVLNHGREYASLLEGPVDAYTFSIFFRPGLANEVAAGLRQSLAQALDAGAEDVSESAEFSESLRPHDAAVSPVLRYIQSQVASGVRDELWLEEQCQFLLTRLVRAQLRRPRRLSHELSQIRKERRGELLRRLEWADDFMHARLQDPITLGDVAAAAHLSRFHFLRLFQAVYGRTPMAHLRELRARRAQALLESTRFGLAEVAASVGMSRIGLWRTLRAHGTAPRSRCSGERPATAFLGRGASGR
jgi:AraC family transcriptional regulator